MTIHFAAARSPLSGLIVPVRRSGTARRAANDNPCTGHSAQLRLALKHFAQHGLGAANIARYNAEQAFFRGDRQGYDHWLGICRILDQRLASALPGRARS